MKKTAAVIFALILFTAFALAEYEPWELVNAGTGLTYDFDCDDIDETMSLSCALDEYMDGSFTLSVGSQSFTTENCVCLEPDVYMVRLDDFSTMFFVNEYGPSDDPLTYCFLYDGGVLYNLGCIPSYIYDMSFSEGGMITCRVRADMIGTWQRSADYILARGYQWNDEDGSVTISYCLCEVPRDSYAMGMIVTLKHNLPLLKTRYDSSPSVALEAGQQVILAASDDTAWLCVSDMSSSVRGWVRIENRDYTDYVLISDRMYEVDAVFDGIFYAD